ncbi:metallophosphatase family protein [Deferribacterales bacterium Es71-Z0220]|uniref:metallophosphoesterase family protein n=1 Tax=Deferrivibrio essentukiensis TaxID=2880922 RepID=UPI001F618F45|nr:metallophosphoesterase family protein [Deferrivibrio essentukiensis]MCB4205346.1 metallophosphatase family protein [Deferrivibrio essentukiensis]
MKITVISDTHTDSIKNIPKKLLDDIALSDAVIHAGDIVGYTLIKELTLINPLIYPVKGNTDPYLPDLLPKKRELNFNGTTVGVIHGDGSPFGLENRLLYEFENTDLIIYGHTHKPFYGKFRKQYLLNPGSPTNNRWTDKNSYAILTIENKAFSAEIIYL